MKRLYHAIRVPLAEGAEVESAMAKDYIVKGRSNLNLREIASQLRKKLGLDGARFVDIIGCLTSGWVETINGRKRLIIDVVPDETLGDDDARANSDKAKATIEVKASVWKSATAKPIRDFVAYFRARFTLTHEYFHVVLCHREGVAMSRGTAVNANTKMPSFIAAYESAEHQANCAAAAFLINRDLAKSKSARDISDEFCVSPKAAEIFLETLGAPKSEEVSKGFEQLSRLLSPSGRKVEPAVLPVVLKESVDVPIGSRDLQLPGLGTAELGRLCPTCGRRANRPLTGNRSSCTICQRVMDAYQDGDPCVEPD
jgi:hypothetical protein